MPPRQIARGTRDAPLKSKQVHALDQAWETIRREFDASCAQVARAARYQLTNELNQLFRRFRHYENESEWISALLDGASRFAEHAAVFSVGHDVCHLRAKSNMELAADLQFPLSSAAAFASAAETKDPVIALRTETEVTSALAGSDEHQRCHVIPIANGSRTVAILFAADQDYMDVNALELVAGMASAVLERRSNVGLHSQIQVAAKPDERAQVAAATQPDGKPEAEATEKQEQPAPPKATRPSWMDLSDQQRQLHVRAQRFARVAVAEMQLAKPQGSRAGREQANLYMFLKPEIDKARESFRKQFMTIPSMVDYLHLELVKTAAEGDELKLGVDYPGQLV